MSGIIDRILSPWRMRKLKREYVILHGFTRSDAEKALARQIALLKSKRPGQSEEWYMEKIIYDLEKDRRR